MKRTSRSHSRFQYANTPSNSNTSSESTSKQLQLLYCVESHNTVIVECDVRSYTAQLVNIFEYGGWGARDKHIAVVRSRQVWGLSTIVSLARLKGLSESQIGDEIGYVFEDHSKYCKQSKVILYTTKSLLNTIAADPLLSKVSMIVLADANERGVLSDLVLALLHRLQSKRKNLRIVIPLSYDQSLLQDFLSYFSSSSSAIHMVVPSKRYPVKVLHINNPIEDYLQAALSSIKELYEEWTANGKPLSNNVIVFVPGGDDAEELSNEVNEWSAESTGKRKFISREHYRKGRHRDVIAMPLYASLPHTAQVEAVRDTQEHGILKIVVATNIAESGIKVQGVTRVVDCGYEKVNVYDAETGVSLLCKVPISRTTARGRARAAGANGPGVCLRLYTKAVMDNELSEKRIPDMLVSDLTELVVNLKKLGLPTTGLTFLTPPPKDAVSAALGRLYNMDMISLNGELGTIYQNQFRGMTISTNLLRSIHIGEQFGVGRHIAAIAAMMQIRHVFTMAPKRSQFLFTVAEGDLITLLNVWRRYISANRSDEWCRRHGFDPNMMRSAQWNFSRIVKTILLRIPESEKYSVAKRRMGLTTVECIQRAIAAGFAENASMVQPDGSYLVAAYRRKAEIDKLSVLRSRLPKWIVFANSAQHEQTLKLRDVTVIDPNWLVELAPKMYEKFASTNHS